MASTYLTRTLSSTSRSKWTFSAWVKRSNYNCNKLFYLVVIQIDATG